MKPEPSNQPLPEWAVIADDLTGACDSGASFACHGLQTVVLLDPIESAPVAVAKGTQVVVLSTESRAKPEMEAPGAVRDVLSTIAKGPGTPFPGRVYKKIDSTLRGHPVVELRAVMDTLGFDRALIAPAFPEQGRVVIDGHLLVHGKRLEITPFGAEVQNGNLREVFGGRWISLSEIRQGSDRVKALLQSGTGVWTADSQTVEDLDTLARAGLEGGARLFCGSAGLARALSVQLGAALAPTQPGSRPIGPVLLIAGSRHPATVKQIAVLEAQGVQILWIDPLRIAGNELGGQINQLVQGLQGGKHAAICVMETAYIPEEERRIAERLGQIAAAVLAQARVGRLVLTGGDTAAAVCKAVACRQIRLVGEAQPGIALGRLVDGAAAGLEVATKAGGFGGEEALVELVLPAQ